MAWLRGIVIALAIFQGGFMTFDGLHAVFTGDYITPERFKGQLGPWASIVEAAGLAPRSILVRLGFVGFGIALLGAAYRFARRRPWSRALLLVAEIAILWWVGWQTPLNLAAILLLLLLSESPAEPERVAAPTPAEVPAEAVPAEPPA